MVDYLASVNRIRELTKLYKSQGWDFYIVAAAVRLDKKPEEVTQEERRLHKILAYRYIYGDTNNV